jgi:hypothetical protein
VAKDNTVYTCGCGFLTKEHDKAVSHCDATSHTMTVTGTMAPDISRKPMKQVPATTQSTSGGAPDRQLDNLRKRFIVR